MIDTGIVAAVIASDGYQRTRFVLVTELGAVEFAETIDLTLQKMRELLSSSLKAELRFESADYPEVEKELQRVYSNKLPVAAQTFLCLLLGVNHMITHAAQEKQGSFIAKLNAVMCKL